MILMLKVKEYKFTVEKHGRKWTQIIIHYDNGKNGSAKTLKEKIFDISAGDTIVRNGKLDIQKTSFGTNVELIILSEKDILDEKEIEKQKIIDKWWGYFLKAYKIGYIYDRAITELHNINYFEKDKEIEKCIEEVENKRRLREAQYKKFSFEAIDGFKGKPKRGELFVENDTVYEVVSSDYHKCDGFSFGVLTEDWYSVKAKDVSNTERGKIYLESYLKNCKKSELIEMARNKKQLAFNTLVSEIKKYGNKIDGEDMSLSDFKGIDIINTFDIYGGGQIIRQSDSIVWLIINNGADGDMWSINNIQTSGAGAYGFYVELEKVKNKIEDYQKAETEFKNIIR